jgi:hypothetical protein
MPKKRKRKSANAQRLGRRGGRSRSEAKTKAARENLAKARKTPSEAKAEAARRNLIKARQKRWQGGVNKRLTP